MMTKSLVIYIVHNLFSATNEDLENEESKSVLQFYLQIGRHTILGIAVMTIFLFIFKLFYFLAILFLFVLNKLHAILIITKNG